MAYLLRLTVVGMALAAAAGSVATALPASRDVTR